MTRSENGVGGQTEKKGPMSLAEAQVTGVLIPPGVKVADAMVPVLSSGKPDQIHGALGVLGGQQGMESWNQPVNVTTGSGTAVDLSGASISGPVTAEASGVSAMKPATEPKVVVVGEPTAAGNKNAAEVPPVDQAKAKTEAPNAEKPMTVDQKIEAQTKEILKGEFKDPYEAFKKLAVLVQERQAQGGFTKDQLQGMVDKMMGASQRERGTIVGKFVDSMLKDMQGEILDLANLEIMLSTAPQRLKELQEERAKAIDEVKTLKDKPEPTNPQDREEWSQAKFQARNRLFQVSKGIVDAQYDLTVNGAKLAELAAKVDRKLGVTSGLDAVWDTMKTKFGTLFSEAAFDVAMLSGMGPMQFI